MSSDFLHQQITAQKFTPKEFSDANHKEAVGLGSWAPALGLDDFSLESCFWVL